MKVLIVDDHPIVISGLKALLESEPGIEVASAMTVASAQALAAADPPDVAVVDVNLPGLSGFELARRMLAANPAAAIVMFSMNDDPVFVAQAMEIGAKGYVSKNDNPVHMLHAITAVAGGGFAWPLGSAEKIAYLGQSGAGLGANGLSLRDKEILRLLAKGKSLSEIADLVGLSYKTIAMTCAGLRTKLHARTQMELVRIALERKLV